MAMASFGLVHGDVVRPKEQQGQRYTTRNSAAASSTTLAPTAAGSRPSQQSTSIPKQHSTNSGKQTNNKQFDSNSLARDFRAQRGGVVDTLGVILDKPKYRQYATIESRLRSFKQWPTGTGQSPETLAEAGFAYTGTGDAVRCYYCAGGFNEWCEKHDPWAEHARHYSHCAHVRQCKGEEFIQMVNSDSFGQCGTKSDKSDGKELPLLKNDYDTQIAIEAAIEFTDKDTVERAVQYFRKTYRDKKITATELLEIVDKIENTAVAEATGLNENTEVIEEEKEEEVDQEEEEEEDEDSREELEKENLKLKEALVCKICLEAEACIITLPCGHMISCAQCIPALVKCAVCRQPIKGTVRAQMAS